MITALFFIFVALVVFHFVYEGIIAPSWRFEQRMKLFAIRDEIRLLKIDLGEAFDDEVYDHLQEGMNKQIALLHNINISGVISAIRLVTGNRELTRKLEEIESRVRNSEIARVKELYNKTLPMSFASALGINSGGWIFYAVPLFVFMVITSVAMVKIVRFVNKLTEVPDDKLKEAFV